MDDQDLKKRLLSIEGADDYGQFVDCSPVNSKLNPANLINSDIVIATPNTNLGPAEANHYPWVKLGIAAGVSLTLIALVLYFDRKQIFNMR